MAISEKIREAAKQRVIEHFARSWDNIKEEVIKGRRYLTMRGKKSKEPAIVKIRLAETGKYKRRTDKEKEELNAAAVEYKVKDLNKFISDVEIFESGEMKVTPGQGQDIWVKKLFFIGL